MHITKSEIFEEFSKQGDLDQNLSASVYDPRIFDNWLRAEDFAAIPSGFLDELYFIELRSGINDIRIQEYEQAICLALDRAPESPIDLQKEIFYDWQQMDQCRKSLERFKADFEDPETAAAYGRVLRSRRTGTGELPPGIRVPKPQRVPDFEQRQFDQRRQLQEQQMRLIQLLHQHWRTLLRMRYSQQRSRVMRRNAQREMRNQRYRRR
jgi:hypothetical protein